MIKEDYKKKLEMLCTVFLNENEQINLSAFRTQETCFIGNILDSLAILDVLELNELISNENIKILDIGTGGGFPLLPLAVCLPDATCIGVDSTQKKVDAVLRIAKHLSIKNVKVICNRMENLGRDEAHREKYDIVTARAVAPLNILLEYASPFVKPKGYVVAWKSMHIAQEIDESLLARAEFSCQIINKFEYDLGEKWGKRQLLIFQKRAPLNKKYPRDVGIPKKRPII